MNQNKRMKNFILQTIIVSSLKLTVETYFDPLDPSNSETLNNFIKFLNYLDYVINFIFILEFLAKSIAKGLYFDNGSYLKDNWNVMDFIIMFFSIIDMTVVEYNLNFVKVSYFSNRLSGFLEF